MILLQKDHAIKYVQIKSHDFLFLKVAGGKKNKQKICTFKIISFVWTENIFSYRHTSPVEVEQEWCFLPRHSDETILAGNPVYKCLGALLWRNTELLHVSWKHRGKKQYI